ncbi:hypothetical protein EDC38_0217 [Marinimicrobium koreense]|jgi:hypothetical protein|uniref:Uncharacterized protein n=1 Tax=Marinimicrobium koreense TaxID=306545 RepID=A0A3N1NLH4_9GAMM|nr:hypothetical protein [Marinimicrobium koreense]ROQ19632.1 hypothetical protein EDC38_0217 [Marinimicrobium koreense]
MKSAVIARRISPLIVTLSLTACLTQPNVKALRDENNQLQRQLDQASDEITDMRVREEQLRAELEERNRVIDVLSTEKSSRAQESSQLRGLVRDFVQSQIDSYRDFLLQSDLLDYVGGELVSRAHRGEESRTLVDLANPIPRSGTLTGVAGYFESPGQLVVKVLRPVDDSLVVVWESLPVEAEQSGVVRLSFPVSVGVDEGDIIAYQFDGVVPVSFDRGTGDTRFQREGLTLGSLVEPEELAGADERRAYSIGVLGLLN